MIDPQVIAEIERGIANPWNSTHAECRRWLRWLLEERTISYQAQRTMLDMAIDADSREKRTRAACHRLAAAVRPLIVATEAGQPLAAEDFDTMRAAMDAAIKTLEATK